MKRLIVCCDGTWRNEEEGEPTNVWKLSALVAEEGEDGVGQRVLYQPGIGTGSGRGWFRRRVARWLAGAFGYGLDRSIEEVYGWLVRAYEPGDELWLFGFSRGAYTVRSLAGLIRNCGLLKAEHEELTGRAMRLYRRRDPDSHPDATEAAEFRRSYAHDVPQIAFIGVWDTIGALGVPAGLGGLFPRLCRRRHLFHDVQLSRRVQHAYHALAIDERRRSFAPALWEGQNLEAKAEVQQVWFAGVHGDVGGGYAQTELSDVGLAWMLERAQGCGLGLERERVAAQVRPNAMGPLHDSRWWFQRLLDTGPYRPIRDKHRQFLHATAVERLHNEPTYGPANLKDAIVRNVPRVGEVEEASVFEPARERSSPEAHA